MKNVNENQHIFIQTISMDSNFSGFECLVFLFLNSLNFFSSELNPLLLHVFWLYSPLSSVNVYSLFFCYKDGYITSISIYHYSDARLSLSISISIYLHLYLSLTIYRSLSIQTLYLSLPLSIAIYL